MAEVSVGLLGREPWNELIVKDQAAVVQADPERDHVKAGRQLPDAHVEGMVDAARYTRTAGRETRHAAQRTVGLAARPGLLPDISCTPREDDRTLALTARSASLGHRRRARRETR